MYLGALLAVLIMPSWATGAAAEFTPPQDGLLLWLDAADSATLQIEDDRVASWTSKAGVESRSSVCRWPTASQSAAARRGEGRDRVRWNQRRVTLRELGATR